MIFYCHLNLYTIISKTHFIRFSLPAWSGFPFQVPGSIGYPLALGQGGCLVFRGDHRATDCNSGGGDSHCWNLEIYWICSVRIHWPEATPIWPWLGLHRTDLVARLHPAARWNKVQPGQDYVYHVRAVNFIGVGPKPWNFTMNSWVETQATI